MSLIQGLTTLISPSISTTRTHRRPTRLIISSSAIVRAAFDYERRSHNCCYLLYLNKSPPLTDFSAFWCIHVILEFLQPRVSFSALHVSTRIHARLRSSRCPLVGCPIPWADVPPRARAGMDSLVIRVEEKTIVVYLLHSRDLRRPATNAHKAPLMHPNRFILLPRLVASTSKSTITSVHKRPVAAE
jgi:hypothetical protein